MHVSPTNNTLITIHDNTVSDSKSQVTSSVASSTDNSSRQSKRVSNSTPVKDLNEWERIRKKVNGLMSKVKYCKVRKT